MSPAASPEQPSLEDLKPQRPEPERLEGQAPSRGPRCCACALIGLGLILAGLGWLWVAAHPSQAKNGAQILSREPEDLGSDHSESLALRFRGGRLQVVSAAGHLWEQDPSGVLRPAFGLAEPGIYLGPVSLQGEWIGLPAGEQLLALDLASGAQTPLPLEPQAFVATTATRAARIAAASELDDRVRVYDAKEGRLLWEAKASAKGTNCLTFAGERLAVGTAGGEVYLYSGAGKQERLLDLESGRATAIAASTDGRWLLVGCNAWLTKGALPRGGLQLWDLESGSPKPALSLDAGTLLDSVSAVALSPAGDYLAAGRDGGELQVWDRSGALLGTFSHDDALLFPAAPVSAIAFDGQRVGWTSGEQVFLREFGK